MLTMCQKAMLFPKIYLGQPMPAFNLSPPCPVPLYNLRRFLTGDVHAIGGKSQHWLIFRLLGTSKRLGEIIGGCL